MAFDAAIWGRTFTPLSLAGFCLRPGTGYPLDEAALYAVLASPFAGVGAETLVQVAKRRDIPRNLPLGVNATEGSMRLDEERLAEDRKWSAVSRSADFAESYPVEFPSDAPYATVTGA